jgi:hypothetical protein
MDITNATANIRLIKAIRVAYRVIGTLDLDAQFDYPLARAWREADAPRCLAIIGGLTEELRHTEGGWDRYEMLRDSHALACAEQAQ